MFTNRKELLKLCTLSGTTEIGRNCNFVEYSDEIVMVDAGYSFPGQEMYGIDYLKKQGRAMSQTRPLFLPYLNTEPNVIILPIE